MVQKGQFREDLYYRLNIIRLHLPPLRERREDIPVLLAFYLEEVSKRLQKSLVHLSSDVVGLLVRYDWPGNIRELVHTVEVLVSLADSNHITISDFPPHLTKFFASPYDLGVTERTPTPNVDVSRMEYHRSNGVRDSIANYEKKMIEDALADAAGNKSLAAQKLGIHRSTLYEKLKRYNLN